MCEGDIFQTSKCAARRDFPALLIAVEVLWKLLATIEESYFKIINGDGYEEKDCF